MLMDEVEKGDSVTRLAAFLSDLRKDLGGISQRQLSERLGVSATTCQSWEAGYAKPGVKNLRKLAALKGISLDELQAYLEGKLEVSQWDGDLPLRRVLFAVSAMDRDDVYQVALAAIARLAAYDGGDEHKLMDISER